VKVVSLFSTVIQVALLCALLWICNLLVAKTGLPIPGSVMGLAVLAALLIFNIVPEKMVALGCAWLLADMLLFFIPPVVSVLKYQSLLSHNGLGIVVILLGGTAIVMGGTALVVDRVFAFEHRLRQERSNA
jgi:holin-like protein